MPTYAEEIYSIQTILQQFARTGSIDKTKLSSFDKLAERAHQEQFNILNKPQLNLDNQRTLFGAVSNMQMAVKIMRERLATAYERRENPTTAELALDVCHSLLNVAPYVDAYLAKGQVPRRREINDASRALYKKAKQAGFSEDATTQINALKISSGELKSFTKKLEASIQAAADIDDQDSGTGH